MCIAKPKCSDISGLFSSLDWFIFFHSCSFGVLDEVHAAQGPSIVVDKMLSGSDILHSGLGSQLWVSQKLSKNILHKILRNNLNKVTKSLQLNDGQLP